jgi:proteasome lid subunit RPN8/RPN11
MDELVLPPAGAEPVDPALDAPPLALTATVCRKLVGYADAVRRAHGEREFAALLLGPRDEPRRCTDVQLLRDQRVSVVSFDCDARSVQESVEAALATTGLELVGLVHLHPEHAFLSPSARDDAWISSRLAPHFAALPRYRRRWSRTIAATNDEEGARIELDSAGLVSVRCPGVELGAVVLEGTQTYDRFFSVIFQVSGGIPRFHVQELDFIYSPVPDEGGDVRMVCSVVASEPEILIEPGPADAVDAAQLAEDVRRWVQPGWSATWGDDEDDPSPVEMHGRWRSRSTWLSRPTRALPSGVTPRTLVARATRDVAQALERDAPDDAKARLAAALKLLVDAGERLRRCEEPAAS